MDKKKNLLNEEELSLVKGGQKVSLLHISSLHVNALNTKDSYLYVSENLIDSENSDAGKILDDNSKLYMPPNKKKGN